MKLEVFLIDDDEITLLIHSSLLKSVAIHEDPRCFQSGEEALVYFKQPGIEDSTILVLLDINMPLMDGWEFLKRLRSCTQQHTLYTIIVTSSIDSADKRKAADYPEIIGFYEKPLSIQKLKELKELEQLQPFFQVQD